MTDEERRQIEIRSILKMAGALPEEEPKKEAKKPAKKTKKTEKK